MEINKEEKDFYSSIFFFRLREIIGLIEYENVQLYLMNHGATQANIIRFKEACKTIAMYDYYLIDCDNSHTLILNKIEEKNDCKKEFRKEILEEIGYLNEKDIEYVRKKCINIINKINKRKFISKIIKLVYKIINFNLRKKV